jgi:protein-histidine pros-kinase
MGLHFKFNLILILVFSLGIAGSYYTGREILYKNAREEVIRSAALMLDMAAAVRNYTVSQVKPHLELQLKRNFLPQSIPAYAATETFKGLGEKYSEFSYKEAALNPTNPRDRAVDWEADLINEFVKNAELKEIAGLRDTPRGQSLYITHPIRITDPACLECHSVPSAAPPSMIARYGEANGFGWQLNDVIGMQIVSVPTSVPLKNAEAALRTFMISFAALFIAVFIILNLLLRFLIVRPIIKLSHMADAVSLGDFSEPELPEKGRDQIARLGQSFNRMRRSLVKAMQLLEE